MGSSGLEMYEARLGPEAVAGVVVSARGSGADGVCQ